MHTSGGLFPGGDGATSAGADDAAEAAPSSSMFSLTGADSSVDDLMAASAPGAHDSLAAVAAASGKASREKEKAHGYRAHQEDEALDEAIIAVESIVLPLGQPVELLPRAEDVLAAQVRCEV